MRFDKLGVSPSVNQRRILGLFRLCLWPGRSDGAGKKQQRSRNGAKSHVSILRTFTAPFYPAARRLRIAFPPRRMEVGRLFPARAAWYKGNFAGVRLPQNGAGVAETSKGDRSWLT